VLSDPASGLIYFLKAIFSHCVLKGNKKKEESAKLIFIAESTHMHTLSQLVGFSVSHKTL